MHEPPGVDSDWPECEKGDWRSDERQRSADRFAPVHENGSQPEENQRPGKELELPLELRGSRRDTVDHLVGLTVSPLLFRLLTKASAVLYNSLAWVL